MFYFTDSKHNRFVIYHQALISSNRPNIKQEAAKEKEVLTMLWHNFD